MTEAPAFGRWEPIETCPTDKTMFLVIGATEGNGFTFGKPYTSDPYAVWKDGDTFARWPHHWPPTHWSRIPPAPEVTHG
jgi:hypothetical protein